MEKVPNPRVLVDKQEDLDTILRGAPVPSVIPELRGWWEHDKKYYLYIGRIGDIDYFIHSDYIDEFEKINYEKKGVAKGKKKTLKDVRGRGDN